MTASTFPVADEHRVLLWQTAAYADDLAEAARSRRRLLPAYDAMIGFLYHRLLPYLSGEEGSLQPGRLRDEQMARLLLTDHQRLRADVDNVESSRTRRLLALAAGALVERLDHHIRREEAWLAEPGEASPTPTEIDSEWALPLLLRADIDLAGVQVEGRDDLVLRRLQWMRRGETVRLRADHDLHALWRQQHLRDPASHVWAYEQDGPDSWVVRVTRRD
jgi:uncharacterized protein (DUF2249 family)